MLPRPRPWFVGLHHHLLCCWPTLTFSPAPAKKFAAMAMAMGKRAFLPPPSTAQSQFLTRSWPHLDFLPWPRPPSSPLPTTPAPASNEDHCHHRCCRRSFCCRPSLLLPSPTFLLLPILVDCCVSVANVVFVTTATASVTVTIVIVDVVISSSIRMQGQSLTGRHLSPFTILHVLGLPAVR